MIRQISGVELLTRIKADGERHRTEYPGVRIACVRYLPGEVRLKNVPVMDLNPHP